MKSIARIYTAFPSEGLSGSSQTYSLHHPNETVMTNGQILEELNRRCPDVEFVGSAEVETADYTRANVIAQRKGLDGILYFGGLPLDLTELGLPGLAVYPLWGPWQDGMRPLTHRRILTTTLAVIPDRDRAVFTRRLDTLAQRIGLLRTTARLKGFRILCVTDRPALGEYEPMTYQVAEEGREAYENRYLSNLAELGAEIVVRPQRELMAGVEAVADREARKVADGWIAEAKGVKGTNESEIRRSAKLYLSMRSMIDAYAADAITTEGYGVFMSYPGGPIPSQGLPSSQFCTDGVVATAETLLDSLLTQQVGLWLTGSTGFNGDYIVDAENSMAYIGHCECPLNPRGGSEKTPYVIRNLPQWPLNEQEKGGACVQVNLPTDEPVTVAKFSVHDRKVAVFSGRAVSGHDLFPGWEDILCRTKLAISADAAKLFANLDWVTFGNHRVVFYGDHKQQFRDFATLLGYEFVEKDK